MGLFSDNKSSITFYIDNLSNYPEIEWYQFQQLTEGIVLVPSGSKEAVEAIRKKLKHGTLQQRIRVLEVLKLLSENSNQRFHRDLISSEKMKERIEWIIESSNEDIKVKKMIMNLLRNWITRFKNERGIRSIEEIYSKGELFLYSEQPKKIKSIIIQSKKQDILKQLTISAQRLSQDLNQPYPHHHIYLKCLEENKKIIHYLQQLELKNQDKEAFQLIEANKKLLKTIKYYESSKNQILQDPFADPY